MHGKIAGMVFTGVMLAGAMAGTARGQASINENLETATLYVDVVNGNDNNSGSNDSPLKTIGKSIEVAESNNQDGIGTHVYVEPGLYRENLNLFGIQKDTDLPQTYEAVTPGTVFISGADPYTNWTQSSGNPAIYSTPWTFNFGLCPPLQGQAPPEPDIHLRREMAIINGVPLEQVLAMSEMLEGTFYVDDAGQNLYIWPPADTNLSTADVELADRGQLWAITNKNGVVLRGLTFEYSADCISNGAVEVNFGGSQNVLFDSDNFLWNNATGLHLFSPLTNYTVKNVVANHNGAVGINAFETTYGLYQNDTADYNNWRGEAAAYYTWGAAGINIYGDANDTFSSINTDWNAATGIHWDTNFANINANYILSRSNLYHGIQLERNTGPMNLTKMVSCNNANEALLAGGATSTAGGITLRDSENVTLTDSLMYGNGTSQFKVIGIAGGIVVSDWLTGRNVTVRNENFTNSGNILEATDATQDVLDDAQLNGSDWSLFRTTLLSNSNTWWNAYNSDSFVLPVPNLRFATNFLGWQTATLQDLNSSFAEPSGNPQSVCQVNPDVPDFWLISNSSSMVLDAAGNASFIDTVLPLRGFDGTVDFTFGEETEIPHLSATVAPAEISGGSGSTTLSLSAGAFIQPGTYQVSLLANSGSLTRQSTVFLVVPVTSLRLSAISLDFPDQQVHTTGNPMAVSIYNLGKSPVKIDSTVSSSPVFAESSTCGSSLPAGQSCTVSVTFTPAAPITYSQTLTITDGDPTSPQVVSLSGTGTPGQ